MTTNKFLAKGIIRKLYNSILILSLLFSFMLLGCALSSEARVDKAAEKVEKIIINFDKIVGRMEIGGYSEIDFQNDLDVTLGQIDLIISKLENYLDNLPPETRDKTKEYYMRKFDETYSNLSREYLRTLEALNIE